MATEYVENTYTWSRAFDITNGLNLLRKKQDALDFSEVILSKADLEGISKLVLEEEATRAFKFQSCHICHAKINKFCEMLAVSSTLTYLNFYDNDIRDEGAVLLAQYLTKNTSINYLSLSKNSIKDRGCAEFAELLKVNNTLYFLGLSKNDISDKGVETIAEALKVNTGLKELILSYNNITAEGDIFLAEALYINRTLTSLSLHQQEISSKGAKALVDVLEVNETITFYGLGIFKAPKKVAKRAKKLLDRNAELQSKRRSKRKEKFASFLTDGSREKYVAWNRCKMMIVGQKSSGKTSLVRSLQGLEFKRELSATSGANVVHLQTQQRTKDNKWRSDNSNRKGSVLTSITAKLSVTQEQVELELQNRISLRRGRSRNTRSRSTSRRSGSRSSASRTRSISLRSSRSRSSISRLSISRASISRERNSRTKSAFSVDLQEARRISVKRRVSKARYSRSRRSKSRIEPTEAEADSCTTDTVISRSSITKPPIVSKEEAESLARDESFVKASEEIRDKSLTYTVWDYGGSDLYSCYYNLFFTKYSVYLVVFSIKDLLTEEEKTLSHLNYYLNNIRIYSQEGERTPVFLIGTHLDYIGSNLQTLQKINKTLKAYFQPLLSNTSSLTLIEQDVELIHESDNCVKEEDRFIFHYLSNLHATTRSSPHVTQLRKNIEEVTRKQSFIKNKIKLRYIGLLDRILKDKHKDKDFITLKLVKKYGSKLGIQSSEEISKVLSLFHNYGLLISLSLTSNLQRYIILNIDWLLNKISFNFLSDKNDEAELERLGLLKDYQKVRSKGIISKDLLEYYWGKKYNSFFIDFMFHTLLLSRIPITATAVPKASRPSSVNKSKKKQIKLLKDEIHLSKDRVEEKGHHLIKEKIKSEENEYLIPLLITARRENFDADEVENDLYSIIFDFKSNHYLPKGLYERFVCLLYEYQAKDSKCQIYSNWAYFSLSSKKTSSVANTHSNSSFSKTLSKKLKLRKLKIILKEEEKVVIRKVTSSIMISTNKQYVSHMLNQVKRKLDKINIEFFKNKLKYTIRLKYRSKILSYSKAEREKQEPWFKSNKKMSFDLDEFLET